MNTDSDFRCPVCGSDEVYLEAYFTKYNGDKDWEFSEAGKQIGDISAEAHQRIGELEAHLLTVSQRVKALEEAALNAAFVWPKRKLPKWARRLWEQVNVLFTAVADLTSRMYDVEDATYKLRERRQQDAEKHMDGEAVERIIQSHEGAWRRLAGMDGTGTAPGGGGGDLGGTACEAGQAFCEDCGWQGDWDLLVIAEEQHGHQTG